MAVFSLTLNYYNEYDPKAAAWLRELIRAGEIPPGDVDTRSITEVSPHDLTGYTQHHFFAGIGGWSLALKLAGWPVDRPVRTGSCPCQPFSAAGKQLGTADERHLWPTFRDILAQLPPATAFGEQVASALGREWLAGVRADLEGMGYAVGAADLCAAGAGAPHIRQRLFWVAHPGGAGRRTLLRPSEANGREKIESHGHCDARAVADTDGGHASAERLQRGGQHGQRAEDGGARGLEYAASDGREQRRPESGGRCAASGCGAVRLGDADDQGPQGRIERRHRGNEWAPWASSVVLPCTDGKARRIEPSAFPLAHGIPGRVGLLRGYGNAIVPQVAAHFVTAYLEATETANVQALAQPGRNQTPTP